METSTTDVKRLSRIFHEVWLDIDTLFRKSSLNEDATSKFAQYDESINVVAPSP